MKVQDPKEIIAKIETISELDLCFMIPHLKEKVLAGMRWGLFSKTGKLVEEMNGLYLTFDHATVQLAQNAAKTSGLDVPVFSEKVRQWFETNQNKVLSIDYDHDCSQVSVLVTDRISSKPLPEKALEQMELRMTMPDIEYIFEQFMHEGDQSWLYPHWDDYEEWVFKNFPNAREFVQIGGHGRWIQGNYEDRYIAQVNADIGDNGSLYLVLPYEDSEGYEDTEVVRGYLDMH